MKDYNSSYNPTEWLTDDMPQELKLAYTCPGGMSSSSRNFKPPLLEQDLEELSHKNFSNETMKQICWVCKIYHDWHYYRKGLGLESIKCDLEDKATITAESLKYALCHFITKVKKLDGTEHPGKTLYPIIVCIQFHLERHGFAFKLINDPAFQDLKYTL